MAEVGNLVEAASFVWRIDEGEPMRRLDQALAASAIAAEHLLSRTRLKALVEEGAVTCGGAICRDPAAKVRAGTELGLTLPAPVESELSGESLPLTIVHEDGELLVIDKPAGMVVHPAPGHATGTLVQALIAHCGESLSGIGGVKRPGIVHRLDKDTSGLLVVAKTDAAHRGLAAQFADHGRSGPLEREYRAFVWGAPPMPAGTVNAALGRHTTHREKIAVRRDGREAITHWRRLADYSIASLMSCRLETGRTHQIRVHMAQIGYPVMGDAVYGSGFKTKSARLEPNARAALAALGRQALHAAILGFEHPRSGATLRFESALPEDMERLRLALAEAR